MSSSARASLARVQRFLLSDESSPLPADGVPASRPVHVQDVFATLYRNLGIDPNTATVSDFNGRPRYLIESNRQPVGELF